MDLKNNKRGRTDKYVEWYPKAKLFSGERPWNVRWDIAMPCATQNGVSREDAKALLNNGCYVISFP